MKILELEYVLLERMKFMLQTLYDGVCEWDEEEYDKRRDGIINTTPI